MRAMGAAVPAVLAGLIDGPRVVDGAFADPEAVRAAVLAQPAMSVPLGDQVFHGIRLLPDAVLGEMAGLIYTQMPEADIQVAFARQSPAGQVEPNDVHSDADMGIATAIVYLNPMPAEGDGTLFWRRRASGAVRGVWDADCQADSHDREAWTLWQRVEARFNRLLLFPADLYHSRAIVANYGAPEDASARLIVVAFLVRAEVDRA